MVTTDHRGHSIALGRLAAAGGVLLAVWLLAWFIMLIGAMAMTPNIDGGGESDAARPIGVALLVVGVVVFLGSGIVAYRVAPTRWILAAPAFLVALAGSGVLVAAVT